MIPAAADVQPRAFVIEPGREVAIAIAPLTTPAARFTALHELGHAVAALVSPRPLARAVDEAAASYVARLCERDGELEAGWYVPGAAAARARRLRISAVLDAIEHGAVVRPTDAPPVPLWDDPAAQAAYVAAETIADRWWESLGPTPPPGALAEAISSEDRPATQQAVETALSKSLNKSAH